MLVSDRATGGPNRQHGRCPVGFAELRRQLACPSGLKDGHRQRLLELARRLARVQALGDKYARLELSEFVRAATERGVLSA